MKCGSSPRLLLIILGLMPISEISVIINKKTWANAIIPNISGTRSRVIIRLFANRMTWLMPKPVSAHRPALITRDHRFFLFSTIFSTIGIHSRFYSLFIRLLFIRLIYNINYQYIIANANFIYQCSINLINGLEFNVRRN